MVSMVRPDFMLVDVNIVGSIDGIELVNKLLKVDPELLVIYVTSYQDERTFRRASQTSPVAFLPKPINEEQILRTLELLVNKISEEGERRSLDTIANAFTNKSVFLKSNQFLVKVKLKDVRYIEVKNRDCIISDGHNMYTIRRTLSEIEEKLPQALLTKVHRSFLVNLSYMDSYDMLRNRIIMGELEIPVSKTYKQTVLASLEVF
jgi:DNA-binding LytR/AlgR family response regulator